MGSTGERKARFDRGVTRVTKAMNMLYSKELFGDIRIIFVHGLPERIVWSVSQVDTDPSIPLISTDVDAR